MRLLDTTTFQLAPNSPSASKKERYAILSHRWVGSEITYEQLDAHTDALRAAGTTPLSSPQQEKIRGACQTARAMGIRWMWIDTCCIDKSSNSELSESLNSMFNWYRDAALCITYLADVTRKGDWKHEEDLTNDAGHPSVWFSRGWTLQELLAPRRLEFFDRNWDTLGDRAELAERIEEITGIQRRYLTRETEDDDPRAACIAAKFSWIAKRQTERDEDMAYSMLGLFGVRMEPMYGESWEAFVRLQEKLLSRSTDESLFAWKMTDAGAGLELLSGVRTQHREKWAENEWGLLAPHPAWFKDCGQMTDISPRVKNRYIDRHAGGLQVRQQGLQISYGRGGSFLGPRHELGRAREVAVTAAIAVLFYATFSLGTWLLFANQKAKKNDDFKYTLNCWDRAESGDMVRVRIWLRVVSGTQDMHSLKRVRCTEVIQARDKSRPKRTGYSGIVLQPWTLTS